ncbi:Quinol monooxygenase YgiN [Methanobrevibacter millerae]|uniref:Quinol monooxygenase YgiN n=1 Tax=Methanobrevibacter millerae TaxID=230361 RepID=A0A1G5XS59_9EURY|nr:Quinol monooxygenase YgiN [Methanobrevibacter millerae]
MRLFEGDFLIFVLAKAIPNDDEAAKKIIQFSEDLIDNSRKEKGNIEYNLYSDSEELSLLFVEKWESIEILDSHLQTEHFIKFGNNIANLLAQDFIINVLKQILLKFSFILIFFLYMVVF